MPDRSKLVKMRITNLGCVGHEGLDVVLDNIICIVGANNCGKSTILRAYELAIGTEVFDAQRDLCNSVPDGPAMVEIWVHIPAGTQNIADKWKTSDDGYLLVRSKWEWSRENDWRRRRFTWDPDTGEYAEDGNASGLDNVFNSRLPQPFRIGSLEDPTTEHDRLLELVLQPIAEKLRQEMDADGSKLKEAISLVSTLANEPIAAERGTLTNLKTDLNRSHSRIFPDLSIDFEIGIGDIRVDPLKLLKQNSHLKFTEWDRDLHWSQQGTGSQRALFWTMLQVRSRLKAVFDAKQQAEKAIKELDKKIARLQKEIAGAKKPDTKAKKQQEMDALEQQARALREPQRTGGADVATDEVALPGYMLIIDEPENGLHPNAIRAACEYLYGLADDPSWQVMLATHSPVFINPLYDHTTIVRLDRSQCQPSPSVYRSESIRFSADDMENLKMLNRFDQGFAEMFFGQLPIVIEGDTEFAAFEAIISRNPDRFPLNRKPVLVRARGKATMLLIIRMLREFKVPFAILHDIDSPTLESGKKNPAWTTNDEIYREIAGARQENIRVVHRVCISNFEEAHANGRRSDGRNKPWRIFDAIKADSRVENSILSAISDLVDPNAREEPFDKPFDKAVQSKWQKWNDNREKDRAAGEDA
ncbi:MAG: AAA family ATPase [Thermoguttaceae bacterium]